MSDQIYAHVHDQPVRSTPFGSTQGEGNLSLYASLGTDPILASVETRLGDPRPDATATAIDVNFTDFTRPMQRIVEDLIADVRAQARARQWGKSDAQSKRAFESRSKTVAQRELGTFMPEFDSIDLDAMLDDFRGGGSDRQQAPSFDVLGQLRDLFRQEWGRGQRDTNQRTDALAGAGAGSGPVVPAPATAISATPVAGTDDERRDRLEAVWHDFATRIQAFADMMPHIPSGVLSRVGPSYDTFGRVRVFGGRLYEAGSLGASLDPVADLKRLHDDAMQLSAEWPPIAGPMRNDSFDSSFGPLSRLTREPAHLRDEVPMPQAQRREWFGSDAFGDSGGIP